MRSLCVRRQLGVAKDTSRFHSSPLRNPGEAKDWGDVCLKPFSQLLGEYVTVLVHESQSASDSNLLTNNLQKCVKWINILISNLFVPCHGIRSVDVSRLLLCSTDDENTVSTWKHLGFQVTNPEELQSWGVCPGDLLHMTNTVQMVKHLDEPREWRPLLIRHQHFVQRTYYPAAAADGRLKRKRESGGCSTVRDEDTEQCDHGKDKQHESCASLIADHQSGNSREHKSSCVLGNGIYTSQDNCKAQQAESHSAGILAHNEICIKELR